MKIKIPNLYVERKAATDMVQKKRKGIHANVDTDFFADPIRAELDIEMSDDYKAPVKGADEENE